MFDSRLLRTSGTQSDNISDNIPFVSTAIYCMLSGSFHCCRCLLTAAAAAATAAAAASHPWQI